MKVLVLKTVDSDMAAHGGFVWPSSGKVECPDWDPEPVCGKGLHGLLWGEGNQRLLDFSKNSKWLVLEVESSEMVDIDGKVKFPRCEVIYCGDMKGAAEKILEVRSESCCPGSDRECCYVDKNKNKYWFKDGKLHREDGPAIEWSNGDKEWYKDGELHREDGPARERATGDKEWHKDGKLHREDGPAIETVYCKIWYLNNKCHREDGPAVEYANGDKEWMINGCLLSEKLFSRVVIQKRIGKWVDETLGEEQKEAGISPSQNIEERCDRFLEEALELAQAIGLSKEIVHKRVDYVFSRPKGDIVQEIGGSLLTLYAVSESCGVDADEQVLKEVERVETPEIREKVRRRQKEKREVVK